MYINTSLKGWHCGQLWTILCCIDYGCGFKRTVVNVKTSCGGWEFDNWNGQRMRKHHVGKGGFRVSMHDHSFKAPACGLSTAYTAFHAIGNPSHCHVRKTTGTYRNPWQWKYHESQCRDCDTCAYVRCAAQCTQNASVPWDRGLT